MRGGDARAAWRGRLRAAGGARQRRCAARRGAARRDEPNPSRPLLHQAPGARTDQLVAALLEAGDDLAHQAALHAVRLDLRARGAARARQRQAAFGVGT
jgi:hypothetical protein